MRRTLSRLTLIAMIMVCHGYTMFAQESEAPQATTNETTATGSTTDEDLAPDSQSTEEDPIRSLREERRETLLYGIDTQILEVLEKIAEERDELLLDDAYATFQLSRNPQVQIAALDLFDELEYRNPVEDVVDIVTSEDRVNEQLLVRAIRFVAFERNEEIADALLPHLDSFDDTVARAAIQSIGKTGDERHAEELLDRFENSRYESERKDDILLALGELKSQAAVEPLIEILDNPAEDATWRRYACDSLGKIGDERALPAIERALGSENAMLRANAVSSLRYFQNEKIIPGLLQGLRDSFWRVRVSAAQALGDLAIDETLDILSFKARLDPETKVRDEAIRAIAKFDSSEAYDLLRGYFEDTGFPLALRVTCAELLIEHDLAGSAESIARVVAKEIGQNDSKLLERTGYFLSITEGDHLAPFYETFLDSGELVLSIYGIRGIGKNQMTQYRDRIESLTGEEHHKSIRRAAATALEQL